MVDTSVTLGPLLPGCFSKTARSRPSHGEAGRHRLKGPSRAIRARRFAHDPAEGAAKTAQTGEPHVETDVGDLALAAAQQVHRAFDPPPLQVAVGRLAEGGSE